MPDEKKQGKRRDTERFAPPDRQSANRQETDAPLEKIDVRPKPPDERFPRRSVPKPLPPELENSPNLYPEKRLAPAEKAVQEQPPRKGGSWVANTITGLLVLLTFVMLGLFVLAIRNPYHPMNPLALATPLPQIITATFLPPTETPILPTATFTRLPVDSLDVTPRPITPIGEPQAEPTLGLPVVVTAAPGTAADTTPTPLGGETAPTETSGRVLPFEQLGDVLYTANDNERACNWASIAGLVYDESGEPLGGVGVRLTDLTANEPITVFTGSSSRYPDGFEYVINNAPVSNAYLVELVTSAGVTLSDEVMVVTSERCNQNVLVINFEQVAPY